MATNLTGTINLTFGKFSQNETFYVTRTAGNDYVAGSGRAVVGTAVLPAAGLTNEGLLLITNDNTVGDLGVSMDGTAYDVVIPPAVSNLISVGPDHAVKVRTSIATATSQGLASATATTVTFDGAQTMGTALMRITGGTGNGTTDYEVRFTSTTVADVFDAYGSASVDLSSTISGSDSVVSLTYFAKYRYVITESDSTAT
tara:strand:+ start:2432 stop:3031 length:600 start_codon:yes stop_codon:yes gene_type:complete